MMPRKRMPTRMVAPPRKKRKAASAIEEITFNFAEREDYLSGFHKRKVQRQKVAREEALKREKEEKVTARRILREGRKADLERHVEDVNSHLRKLQDDRSEGSDNEADGGQADWEGLEEPVPVDRQDEYVDDDRFTTVTVEAVEVSKDGLHKVLEDDGDVDAEMQSDTSIKHGVRPDGEGSKVAGCKDMPGAQKRAKTKKKKFKYESKAERKVTRHKERSGSRKQAKARRG